MPAVSSPHKVSFHHIHKKGYQIPGRSALKKFITSLFKKEGKALDGLQYIFCDDSYLLKINQSFLGHDFYTDIISFELAEKGAPVQGEIYISLDRVRENAALYGVPLKKELLRVIFHGALHLCGYRDKKPAEIRLMRQMEDKYLGMYTGIS